MAASTRSRLLRLAEDAVGAVEAALKRGDARSALTLLRSLGMMNPPIAGSADPEAIRRKMELDQRQQEIAIAARKKRLSRQKFDVPLGLLDDIEPPQP